MALAGTLASALLYWSSSFALYPPLFWGEFQTPPQLMPGRERSFAIMDEAREMSSARELLPAGELSTVSPGA
ncbi:hypothetical protein IWX90DRAFT_94124 [Phyllosticta citrichinensis]|uniref:Uncharacterized protein n=1 Tax=Phyllosticta citrichinensis TaxID=1130410 RepID=A0ABR1XF10_9PEZI